MARDERGDVWGERFVIAYAKGLSTQFDAEWQAAVDQLAIDMLDGMTKDAESALHRERWYRQQPRWKQLLVRLWWWNEEEDRPR